MKIWQSINEHWELIASVIAGGGSAIGAKKYIDREQNRKLKEHEEQLLAHKERMADISSDIAKMQKSQVQFDHSLEMVNRELKQNAQQDRDFREMTKDQIKELKDLISQGNAATFKIMEHLMK